MPPDSYDAEMQIGIDAFYSADWEEAKSIFQSLKKDSPEKPLAYFMDAMIPFWLYFFGGENPEFAGEFQVKSDRAIRRAESYLEQHPSDTSTVLMLSGLYGYQSLVAANESQYRRAMSTGINGYSYTRKIMDMDTDNPNALIGQGVFQYMVGSVPAGLRWMATMAGLKGDKEQGLELLEKAARSDSYVSVDAAMILCYLYIRDEEYQKAADAVSPVAETYPENMIFQFYLGKSLENSGRKSDAAIAYRNVVNNAQPAFEKLREESKNRLEVLAASL